MATKKVYLKKKISGTVYDIYARTSADMVDYDDAGTATTVSAKLASLATGIGNAYTKDEVDAEITKLYNKIMGFTDSDKTIEQAYDTLKEVATYLSNNADAVALITGLATTVGAEADAEKETAATGLIGDIRKLQDEVEKATTGLLARATAAEGEIDDLQAVVGDSSSGLVKDVADLKAVGSTKVEASSTNGNIKINDAETTVYDDSALAGKVTALEGTVGNTSSGLVKDVAALQAVGANKVEAATNNGYIKVDGTDNAVQVYDDSILVGKLTLGKNADNEEYATVKAYVEAVTSDITGDVNGKADLVSGATAGNFAGLDGEGNLTDSGKKASDFVAAEANKRLMTDAEGTKLAGIADDATKVEASSTNGNIKINGTETTVYDDSAIAASKIVESDERKFVSATEKAKIATYVSYVTAMPDEADDATLYIVDAE